MSETANPGAADESVPKGFTAEDLRLGRKATHTASVLCVAALVACVAIAGFVFLNVPWDTRMPYDGKHDYSGRGIPMQIAMLPAPVVLLRIWRVTKAPDEHHRRKGARVRLYILMGGFTSACVIGQWVMASGILKAGGYL